MKKNEKIEKFRKSFYFINLLFCVSSCIEKYVCSAKKMMIVTKFEKMYFSAVGDHAKDNFLL